MNEKTMSEIPAGKLYERISAEVRQQRFFEPAWGHALMVTGRDKQRAIPLYMDLRLEQLRHAEMLHERQRQEMATRENPHRSGETTI